MKRLGEIKVGKRLSEEEMKQIKAGSFLCFRWKEGSGALNYFEAFSAATARAWCDAWSSFEYNCTCREESDPSLYIWC